MTTYGVAFNCSYETRRKLTIANVNHIIACMSNVNAEFGYLAESIIKRKGMTKKAVSEKSGIPYSTFNFMLRGQRAVTSTTFWQLPKPPNLSRLHSFRSSSSLRRSRKEMSE